MTIGGGGGDAGRNKSQLKAHCHANKGKYHGLLTWRTRSAQGYREQIELRDLHWDGWWNPP